MARSSTRRLYIMFGTVALFIVTANLYLAVIGVGGNSSVRRPSAAPAVRLRPTAAASVLDIDGDTFAPLSIPPRKHSMRKSTSARKKDAAELVKKRLAFQSHAVGFANASFSESLAMYAAYLRRDVGQVNQSSAQFVDFVEAHNSGIRLPEEPIIHGDTEDGASECDHRDTLFTVDKDDACETYLGDPSNWLSIKPMSSILSTGRTLKFKLYLKNGASAVMKIPQKKFVLESSSEYLAYLTDRHLGFHRVPYTAWVGMPLDYLKAAAATQGPLYAHWFQKFVLEYDHARRAIHKHPSNPAVQAIYVSVQLWMADVHNADETVLRPPHGHTSLRTALDAAVPFPTSSSNRLFNASVAELSDVAVFDFVIGNTDRWQGHNSFVYGGCDRCSPPVDPDRRMTAGEVRYAFIDQGSSFYNERIPKENLYYWSPPKKKKRKSSEEGGSSSGGGGGDGGGSTAADGGNLDGSGSSSSSVSLLPPTKMCRFRSSTVKHVLEAAEPPHGQPDFYAAVLSRVPRGVFGTASKVLVKAAKTRLVKMAGLMKRCVAVHGAANVNFFGG